MISQPFVVVGNTLSPFLSIDMYIYQFAFVQTMITNILKDAHELELKSSLDVK